MFAIQGKPKSVSRNNRCNRFLRSRLGTTTEPRPEGAVKRGKWTGPKSCLQALGVFLGAGVFLLAADPAAWKKPVASWTPEDTKRVLADSPWAKIDHATIIRKQSEDERRAGGNMGDAKGIGYDGLQKDKIVIPKSIVDMLFKPEPKRPPRPQMPVLVRWESALAVRMAEFKGGTFEPPTLAGEGYKVAVYGIPTADVKGDPKVLGEPLKDNAFLRREGEKDVKPISVEVFQQEDSMVAVYLFPFSAELKKKDGNVEFGALIGRISVTQSFNLLEMEFQGKLDL